MRANTSAKTKKPKQIKTLEERLAQYNIIRQLAQDAADIAEKWGQTQYKTLGRKPQSIDKKARACAQMITTLPFFGIYGVPIDIIEFFVEAAVAANTKNDMNPTEGLLSLDMFKPNRPDGPETCDDD